ncbi:MAG: hypothetical protein B6I22_07325 [Desulfobacteraceae bacterium 4572_123]|nr:MAG: hypothetical protein B6I22_07325 [Desulfobacteraceae bacterium 4572_123]
MSKIGKLKKGWMVLVVMATIVFLATGCSHLPKGEKNTETPVVADQDAGPVPLYYDFGDVLIPSELKVDKKSSFVFRTANFSAGVISLKGRVEVSSLLTFFNSNMQKDNWKEIASFKSPRSVIMYEKANRYCVINISEKNFTTYVEIWVAPTL